VELEVHAVDRLDQTVAGRKLGLEASDPKQWLRGREAYG
jgi:hypothetical protein